jgi:hypothetical protein
MRDWVFSGLVTACQLWIVYARFGSLEVWYAFIVAEAFARVGLSNLVALCYILAK